MSYVTSECRISSNSYRNIYNRLSKFWLKCEDNCNKSNTKTKSWKRQSRWLLVVYHIVPCTIDRWRRKEVDNEGQGGGDGEMERDGKGIKWMRDISSQLGKFHLSNKILASMWSIWRLNFQIGWVLNAIVALSGIQISASASSSM